MKTKKAFIIYLSIMLIVVLSCFAVACQNGNEKEKEPTLLTIDSKEEVTIEVGAEYTLLYTCEGTVTVTVNGGTYNKDTHRFSATEAGVYTLVVTGIEEGKSSTVKNVKVTVIAGADKTALNEAIKKTEGLISSDYTEESWQAVTAAQSEANRLLKAANVTAGEIATTAGILEKAIEELEPAEITKADVSNEDRIVYSSERYNAEDYENFTAIVNRIKALNADDSIVLNSVYATKIAEILGDIQAKAKFIVTGAPEGKLIVSNLITYEINVDVNVGTTVAWKINNQEVTAGVSNNGLTLTFAPDEFDKEYVIAVTATADKGEPVTKTYTCSFIKADYTVNEKFTNKISVENNVIDVHEGGTDWDNEKGRKVVLKDLNLYGEFTLTLDVQFKTNAIMGLFLLTQDGINVDNDDNHSHYIVINNGDRFMGIGINQGGGEPHYDNIPDGVVSNNAKFTLRVTRYKEDGKWYLKGEVINGNGEVVKEGSREGCTGNNVTLGIQTENGTFTVSDIRLINGTVIDRKVITAAKDLCDIIDETIIWEKLDVNFSNEKVIKAYKDARQEIYDAYYTPDSSPERIENAISAFAPAYEALCENKIDLETVMAEIAEDKKSFSYANEDYTQSYYTNIEDIIAEIETLNSEFMTDMDDKFVSDYQTAIKPILAKLKFALEVALTATDGNGKSVANNNVVIGWADGDEYTLTAYASIAADTSATFTYKWSVDGKAVDDATGTTYALTAAQGTHAVEALVTYGEGDNAITVSKTYTIAFEKANVNTHEGVTDNKDGSFTANTGIGWSGDWEGRKVVFDELVFNGSFSVQMDVNFNKKVDGANVVTIHFLNADTLSRYSGRDKAIVGYGCICLQDNPVKLETYGPFGKLQSDAEGYEEVATAMGAAASQFAVGQKFTVKLDVYRTANGQVACDFSVYDTANGKWITFSRGAWGGDFGGGFIVGVNIENAGVTLSNCKFELLEEGTLGGKEYIAGSVKSKAELHDKYIEYIDLNPTDYINGGALVNACYGAYEALCDNTADADYVTALANIKAAYSALVERGNVTVTVEGLDAGYNNYSGYDKFMAVLPEGATNVQWTYDFLAADAAKDAEPEAKTVTGAELALTAGTYSNVKLIFTADSTAYEFTYQDFVVKAFKFKDTYGTYGDITISEDNLKVNEDGTVDMKGITWDNPREQLVLEGLQPHEFEFSVDVTYNGGNVICFRLSELDVRMVVRFEAGQIGFDEFGDYVGDFGGFTSGETYKFKISAIKNNLGEYVITFSVYNASGDELAKKARRNNWGNQHFDDKSTRTDLNITDENVTCKFSNIKIMYN